MLFYLRILFFLTILSFQLEAQNLVRNPSFETDTPVKCFGRLNGGYLAFPWRGTRMTPVSNPVPPVYADTVFGNLDLFSTCADPGLGAPLSDIGYQYPHFGESYGGIHFTYYYHYYMLPPLDDYSFVFREWAQGGLSEPLEAGMRYNFSVWVSLADRMEVNVWQLGLRLSNTWFYRENAIDSLLPPLYWENDSGAYIQQSCDEWVQLHGTFVAQGGEQYFMFGSSLNSPSAFPDSIHISKDRCYNRYDSIYRSETNGYLNFVLDYSYLFLDDFAIWREDKQVHVAEAGKGGTLCLGQQESITLGSSAREQYHYFWLNLQGYTLGTTAQLTVSPIQTTTYILSQWDFKFDQTWDTVTVYVEPNCPELWLPTWFAPSQSQYWHPQWRDIEYWEVTVYNSLGQVVHRYKGTPEQHPGWDGTSIATGVYHAVVNARAYNGEQLRAVEKVMVLR